MKGVKEVSHEATETRLVASGERPLPDIRLPGLDKEGFGSTSVGFRGP